MKVGLLYYRFLDSEGKEKVIGGIETYLASLAQACIESGWEPILFQCANREFRTHFDGLTVLGVPTAKMHIGRQKLELYKTAGMLLNLEKDVVVFGADFCSVQTNHPRSVSIHHGVAWDACWRFLYIGAAQ